MIGPGDIATASLFLMMVAMGMGLRPADFARVVRLPVAFVLGTVGQIVLLPLVAFGLAYAFGLEAEAAVGLVLLAACPGGATSNAFSQLARGDVALSVSLTAVSGFLSFVTVPLVVGLAIRAFAGDAKEIKLPFGETALRLFTTTALPVSLGMVALRLRPEASARWRRPLLLATTAAVVLLVVGLGAGLTGADALRLFLTLGPGVAALLAAMAVLAWAGGAALRLPPTQRRTLVIELAIQNFNLALVVALTGLGDRLYLGPSLVYLPFMLVFAGLVVARASRGRRSEDGS